MEKTVKLEGQYDPSTLVGPEGKDVLIYEDPLVRYLKLKVTRANRSWVFDCSMHGKRFKRFMSDLRDMGLAEARRMAFDWAASVRDGNKIKTLEDRAKDISKKQMTVGHAFDIYWREYAKNKRSAYDIENGKKLHWGPILGVRIADLDTRTIKDWMSKIRDKKGREIPMMANKQLRSLRACLNYLADEGTISLDRSLFASVKEHPELKRSEYLTPEQFKVLYQVLQTKRPIVRDQILLMLYTFQRRDNVQSMEWSELDTDSCTWTIPAHKTKPGRPYTVALTTFALEIILRRKAEKGPDDRYVFPSVRGGGYLYNIQDEWDEIRKEAGIEKLVLHSMKHTGGTWLADMGANDFQIQKMMQHASLRTSQNYTHLGLANVREMMESTLTTKCASPEPAQIIATLMETGI